MCSLIMLAMLVVSVAANAYLAMKMSGVEVVVKVPIPDATQAAVQATPPVSVVTVVMNPTDTPTLVPTPTPVPTQTPSPTPLPTATFTASPVPPPTATATITQLDINIPERQQPTAVPSADEAAAVTIQPVEPPPADSGSNLAQPVQPFVSSDNQYPLIPLESPMDSRPPAEHGDLNLALRDPQPSTESAKLINYSGATEAGAPRLSAVFGENFVKSYVVHDWDWGCNCPGKLRSDGYLLGMKPPPGEPVYIPPTPHDIWQGKYYAVVLYADEQSVTFVYAREGTVANSYVIHYMGLQTDPNLLEAYRLHTQSEVPGLALDTPVGLATDELIVSVRDKGTFMDTRSRKDWWY